MADQVISTHMTTGFRVPRSEKEDLWHSPPKYHYLAWVCGGLGDLYSGQRKSISQGNISRLTDENGCFSPKETAPLLAKRYQFIEEIGRGGSAVVVKARDTYKRGDCFVAIKILHESFFDLGYQESNCLRRLNQADPGGFSGAIRLQNTFQFGESFCMVYELLQPTPLHHYFVHLEQEQKLPLIRKIGIKLLQLLGFLQSQNVIHADLKPENILCDKNGLDGKIKVIDFGNAIHCVYDELALYYDDYELQTLIYRAPEVICGLPFGPEIDMWSVGCILAELYIGQPLFFALKKEEILGKVYQLLGPLPVNIYQRGKFYRSFDHLGGPPQPYIETFNKLRSVLRNTRCADMVSFILGFLQYDAGKRMTVREAVQHPFLAPEVAFGYVMQNESAAGPCYSGGISISPFGYTHSPKVDKELKGKKLNTLQLLRRGTKPKTSPERREKAVAQVTPFSRSNLMEEDQKSDAGMIRESQMILRKDKSKEQMLVRGDNQMRVKTEGLFSVGRQDVVAGENAGSSCLKREGNCAEPKGTFSGFATKPEQANEMVTLKTSLVEDSKKSAAKLCVVDKREHKTKITTLEEGETRETKKQDFGTRRKRKTSTKEEERNEMELAGVINFNGREVLQKKEDVLGGVDQKRLTEKELFPSGRLDSLARCDTISCSQNQEDSIQQTGTVSGISGNRRLGRGGDVVKTNSAENKSNDVVVTQEVEGSERKTALKASVVRSGGEDVKQKIKLNVEQTDDHTSSCASDKRTSSIQDKIGHEKEFVTMEMQQLAVSKTQEGGRRKQSAQSLRKKRALVKSEELEKVEVERRVNSKEGDVQRGKHPPQRRCSPRIKDFSEKEFASSSERKRLAWQVYEQFEEEELADPPGKRRKRKSFARQLEYDDETKGTKTGRNKMVDRLIGDLGKLLEETKGQPLKRSRRSTAGESPSSATVGESPSSATVGESHSSATVGESHSSATVGESHSSATVGESHSSSHQSDKQREWKKERRKTKDAVKNLSGKSDAEKTGEGAVKKGKGGGGVGNTPTKVPRKRNVLNTKRAPKKDTCAKGKGSRKSPADETNETISPCTASREENISENWGDSVTLELPSSVSEIDSRTDSNLKKIMDSKQRPKRKSCRADLGPPTWNMSGRVAKMVSRKGLSPNFKEQDGSRMKNVRLQDTGKNNRNPLSSGVVKRQRIKGNRVSQNRENAEERALERSATRNREGNDGERGQHTKDTESCSFDSILQITPGKGKTGARSTAKNQQTKNRRSRENQSVDRGQQMKHLHSEEEEEDSMLNREALYSQVTP